ncbi:MAG: ParB N-terminal domain-containing protein [Caulobacteraceae bacterium]|nr:ParB N-terminal domain-containing protein [Caulobacteraceae bacterium]
MRLDHADIGKLTLSPLNMRYGKRPPDVSDILPSVRRRGVLQTLIVREKVKDGAPDPEDLEIIAGARRYYAARAVTEEGGQIDPLPVAIIDPGDDAAAIEASLIENFARLDPDEVTQWRTFTRLIAEGRTEADLSETFGITPLTVKRVLALGNLLPRIRDLYRAEKIETATIRLLTLATKAQQKDWLALYDDPAQAAPRGQHLKAWLLGGQSISTKVALFPLDQYPGAVVADLFGEDSYFADAEAFWTLQNQAVAARCDALREDGWIAVVVLGPDERFAPWSYEKTPKKKGGKVFVGVLPTGEVEVHEGYLPLKEARRARAQAAKGEAASAARPARRETTSSLQDYIDLHRHGAVRSVLLDHPGVALRLVVAHAIAGSALWTVKPDPQRTRSEDVAKSVRGSDAEARFTEARRAALAVLDLSSEEDALTGGNGDDHGVAVLFARLLALGDEAVLGVVAVVMGETLAAGSAAVEAAGVHLGVQMAGLWRADDAFFELIRDREVANALLRDVAGRTVAASNLTEKVKVQKKIVRDFLAGANGRPKVEDWTPVWLRFPAAAYTDRPFATLDRWTSVAPLFTAPAAPEPVLAAAE